MLEALTERAPAPVANRQFLNDVLRGLSQPQKALPPKYFYDTRGSEYFDRICELEEYYPYRTELNLLPQVAAAVDEYLQQATTIVEFGAGSLKKIQPLLDTLGSVRRFVPIDIAGDFLATSCSILQEQFPSLQINPIEADFCQPVSLPDTGTDIRLGFFPGSTIGNFTPLEAKRFLSSAGGTLGRHSYLLIGVDTKKSPSVLHKAYNDSKNVTAEFNLNLLHRINEELLANFAVDRFEHYAFYNASEGCVEMHLVSAEQQEVFVAGQPFYFERGESIHTESSYKYNPEEFRALASASGWKTRDTWVSNNGYFSMHLLERA